MARSYSILIAEDERILSAMLAYNLEHCGYSVATADSAVPALEILKSGHPVDLLLTDIQMPGEMDGQALAKRARKVRPEIAVIYMSGHYRVIKEIDAVPGASLLPKPFVPSTARQEIERILARPQLPQRKWISRVFFGMLH